MENFYKMYPFEEGQQSRNLSTLAIGEMINNLLVPTPTLVEEEPSVQTSSPRSPTETSLLNGPRGSFVITDILTSILALIGNLLILSALMRTKFALSGYRRFLLSLLAADIFMATTAMLAVLHQILSVHPFSSPALEQCGNVLLRSLTLVSYFASLLSIAGLTVDNFIGVFFEIRYRNWMTGQRLTWSLITLWLLSFLLGFADTIIALANFVFVKLMEQSKQKNLAQSAADNFMAMLPSQGKFDEDLDYEEDALFAPEKSKKSPLQEIKFITLENYYENSLAKKAEDEEAPQVPQHDVQLRDLISDVLNLVEIQQKDHFCRIFSGGAEKFSVEFFVIGLTIPCFVLVLVIYCCIFVKVMRRKHIGDNNATPVPLKLSIAPTVKLSSHGTLSKIMASHTIVKAHNSIYPHRNYARLVLTTLMLISSFAFCWMSFVLFELFVFVKARIENSETVNNLHNNNDENGDTPGTYQVIDKNETLLIINSVFNSLLMLSPLINPIIYAARLPRVREQLIKIVRCDFKNLSRISQRNGYSNSVINDVTRPSRQLHAVLSVNAPLLLKSQRSNVSTATRFSIFKCDSN